MPLAEDLLEQARHLATRDSRGRPRQHNLRRAVSGAYYALFHFFVDRACRVFVGNAAQRRPLRAVLGRAFDPMAMRKASASFAAGMLPARLQPGLAGAPIPADLRKIAETFRTIQEARHAADYDLLRQFEREEVMPMIEEVDEAMRLRQTIEDTPAARLYLLALLVGERVRE